MPGTAKGSPGFGAGFGARSFVLVMVFAAGWGVRGAESSTVLYQTLEEMVRAADQIVTGRVVGVRSQVNARRNAIHTFVTIEADEYLKGGRGGNLVTLRILGGEAEGYRLVVPGAPRFQVGEEVLVFSQGGAGRIPSVLGLAAGKFTLERDFGTGDRFVTRSLAGLKLEDPNGGAVQEHSMWLRGRTSLGEIRRRIREALSAL